MSDVLAQVSRIRLVPVIALDDAAQAPRLAQALVAGGLPVAEVTFRTAAAAAAIRSMAADGRLLVGAGTVLTSDQVQQAQDAGARFIVSPGFNPKVVSAALKAGLPVFPGVATPTEIEMALDHGLSTLKFFPAEALGGVKMLKAISAPYGQVRFIPTGGIEPGNLKSYLALPSVVACGGSWMVAKDLVKAGNFEKVRELAQAAVALAR